jgi:hypothetical protein
MSDLDLPEAPAEPVYFRAGRVSTIANHYFSHLSGRIMTIIDASLPEGQQCKAAKDIACQAIWQVYNEMWDEMSRKCLIEVK